MGLVEKIFGDLNKREVKKIEKIVDVIESYDEQMQKLTDEELRAKTEEFKKRLLSEKKVMKVLLRLWMTFCQRHLPCAVKVRLEVSV